MMLAAIRRFCRQATPPPLDREVVVEMTVRGNFVTIWQRRPPPDDTSDGWTRMHAAQLRYPRRRHLVAVLALSESMGAQRRPRRSHEPAGSANRRGRGPVGRLLRVKVYRHSPPQSSAAAMERPKRLHELGPASAGVVTPLQLLEEGQGGLTV